MRDPRRIPGVLKELEAAWLAHPDWRLGQLIENAVRRRRLFFAEDAEVVEGLRNLQPERREEPPASEGEGLSRRE